MRHEVGDLQFRPCRSSRTRGGLPSTAAFDFANASCSFLAMDSGRGLPSFSLRRGLGSNAAAVPPSPRASRAPWRGCRRPPARCPHSSRRSASARIRGAIAGIDEVGVEIDEARRDPGAARVVHLARLAAPFAARSDPGDPPPETATRRPGSRRRRAVPHGRKVGVDARPRRACRYDSGMKKYFAREALLPRAGRSDVRIYVHGATSSRSKPNAERRRSSSRARRSRGWPTCIRTPSSARWPGSPRCAARPTTISGPGAS